MSDILLEALEIENFRGFKHLQISQLGRVNLIVGKNNVGKTSLLEALSIYAHRGDPTWIWRILKSRDENSQVIRRTNEIQKRIEDIKYIFHGRKNLEENRNIIKIGTGKDENTLSIKTEWYVVLTDEQGLRKLQPLLFGESGFADALVPVLVVTFGKEPDMIYRLDSERLIQSVKPNKPTGMKCIYIPANGLNNIQIGEYWDNITLTSLQQQVIESLRIIEPGVDGLNFIKDKERSYERDRTPVIRISDVEDRLPLKSLGEGMNRMLGISLAISNAADGVLLIDEIESGLHYSVQADMWRVVLQMARTLNVRVFATTHSWDCIEGFQKAIQKENRKEGFLIRLGRKKEDIVATVYDETELAVITRDQIEVR